MRRTSAVRARTAFGLSAALVTGCAQVLGVSSDASTLEDFCSCSALRGAETQCKALAARHQDDIAFLRSFVDAGCTECKLVPACYERLGALADDAPCDQSTQCASLRCCSDGGVEACCSACRRCADTAAAPSAHCTGLFDALRQCLLAHAAECPAECGAAGPQAYGDPCFACLYAKAAECQPLYAQCGDEP